MVYLKSKFRVTIVFIGILTVFICKLLLLCLILYCHIAPVKKDELTEPKQKQHTHTNHDIVVTAVSALSSSL